MLTTQVALIDNTGILAVADVAAAASAIAIQVTRDLSQFWPVSATLQVLPESAGVPPGVFPVYLVANLPVGEGGVHLAGNNQPYANVEVGDGWTIAASHEVCEMLVDPSTNKMQAAPAIQVTQGVVQDADGIVEYLVEVCDPSEGADYGYSINGIAVSDFYTPHYFDSVTTSGVRYSFTGAITAPRQVRKGGYLSWKDPASNAWSQLDYVNFDPPSIVPLDVPAGTRSFRESVDALTRTTRIVSATSKNHQLLRSAAAHRRSVERTSSARSKFYLKKGPV
jgi:hypothetical protein